MSENSNSNPQGEQNQQPQIDVERDYEAAQAYSTRAGEPATPTGFSPTAHKILDDFKRLGADEQLALFYYVYEKMGDSITPAAPTAAEPELAPRLLQDFQDLSEDEQLAIMRDIVECKDTEWSRTYGALTENNQLLVWYFWAVKMGETVVDMPSNYQASQGVKDLLARIEALEFEEQISLLRQWVSNMGYSEIGSASTQGQTGTSPSLG